MRSDRTAEVIRFPARPDWDWDWAEDGNLALDRHELRAETLAAPRIALSQAQAASSVAGRVRVRYGAADAGRLPPSPRGAPASAARSLRRHRARAAHRPDRRLRRRCWGRSLITAFGQGATREPSQALPGPASRLLPVGPPTPLTVALHSGAAHPAPDRRRAASPRSATTRPATARSPLSPLGRQGNEARCSRLAHKIFGGGGGGPRLVPARGGRRDGGARRRRRARDGRLRAGRRHDRRDLATTSSTDGATARASTSNRSAAPSLVVSLTHLERRSGAHRRLDDRRVEHEGRPRARPLGRREAGALEVHAGRRATTWRSRFAPPPRSDSARPARSKIRHRCRENPLRRRRRRRARTTRRRGAPAVAARRAARRLLHRQRREPRRRRRDHAEARATGCSRPASTRSRSATTRGAAARSCRT